LSTDFTESASFFFVCYPHVIMLSSGIKLGEIVIYLCEINVSSICFFNYTVNKDFKCSWCVKMIIRITEVTVGLQVKEIQ